MVPRRLLVWTKAISRFINFCALTSCDQSNVEVQISLNHLPIKKILHSVPDDLNTTRANHSPCCAKRTTPANLLSASSTSFSGSKLNEARTYGVGLPDMKKEVPGSARTPASTAFSRMRASELPSGAPSDGGRSNLNLE